MSILYKLSKPSEEEQSQKVPPALMLGNLYILPTHCIYYGFHMNLTINSDSLRNINLLLYIMDTYLFFVRQELNIYILFA
jgi:hypothetical protein